MFSLVDKCLDWIYPPKCIICNEIIPINCAKWFCFECLASLEQIQKPVCKTCGRSVASEQASCGSCAYMKNYYERNVSIFAYEGEIRNALHSFKYGKHPSFAKAFGRFMAETFEREYAGKVDLIVPVPMFKGKEKRRGFNQSTALANELSKRTGVPVCAKGLIRTRDTAAQAGLNAKEREQNLKGAFFANEQILGRDKSILLVDDIFTTGSTINACALELREKGTKNIYVLSVSSTLNKKN